MSESVFPVDVAGWVERVRADPIAYQQRQTIEIALNAIAMTKRLQATMFLKGGILMGLAHGSPRQTADIDLTTVLAPAPAVGDDIRQSLDAMFPRAAAELGYADLIVRTHTVTSLPRTLPFAEASFPALQLKIACAQRGTIQERALRSGKTPVVIAADISFNERLQQVRLLELTGGQSLRAYGLVDLIAEKYRALLQQVTRRRQRPQDVYGLDRLLTGNGLDEGTRVQILDSLVAKCRVRHIEPTASALDDPELRQRAEAGWQNQTLELGSVPDFTGCYERVAGFYRDLPWPPSGALST